LDQDLAFHLEGRVRQELKRWVDSATIRRVRRGVYLLKEPSHQPEEVVASIPQPCALAGISSLVYWEYSEFIPEKVWVAVPHTHLIDHPEVQTVRQIPRVYELGLTEINTDWGKITIFDREKSVIDGLRGTYLDQEEKFRVLRRWLADSNKNRRHLNDYASKIKVKKDFFQWLAFLRSES
jgi:predicted transcriptional regulator of viral defense system